MSRAVKSATVSFGSTSYELESVPVGVPAEREMIDVTSLGDEVKKYVASSCEEKGEIELEVLHVGEIATTDEAQSLSVTIENESGTDVTISFGNCFLAKVDPGSASTSDRKATQKLTFRPAGGSTQAAGGGGGGGGSGNGTST